jgi:hypothetical protein
MRDAGSPMADSSPFASRNRLQSTSLIRTQARSIGPLSLGGVSVTTIRPLDHFLYRTNGRNLRPKEGPSGTNIWLRRSAQSG